jgi:hypothetical protein
MNNKSKNVNTSNENEILNIISSLQMIQNNLKQN